MKREWKGSKKEKKSLNTYIKLRRGLDTIERRIQEQQPLPAGLTISQFAVLEVLYFHGPLQQSVIALKVLSSTGNVTFVIDNLVKAGLVKRSISSSDRRIRLVELTETGEEMIASVFPRMAEAITKSFSHLSDEEMDELARLLKRMGTGQREQKEVKEDEL